MIDLRRWSSSLLRALPILWTLVILYLTLSPSDGSPSWFSDIPHFDKMVHLGLFSIWAAFFSLNFKPSEKFFNKNVTIVILLGLVLGGLTEYFQRFVENRSSDGMDFIADSVGVLLGVFSIFLAKKNDYLMY